jgi:hypothetical protein
LVWIEIGLNQDWIGKKIGSDEDWNQIRLDKDWVGYRLDRISKIKLPALQ